MSTPIALQKWRKENKERVREISRECYHRNREQHLARQKKWRQENQDYLKKWQEDNRERRRAAGRKKEYNLLPEEHARRLAEQENCCALCRKQFENYDVDHDHSCCSQRYTCGKCTRGLLCHGCNTALGLFQESEEILQRTIEYLRLWKERNA